jgi:DnaJ family protein B protein 12
VEDFGNSDKRWKKLDTAAEVKYVHMVNGRCQSERAQQRRIIEDAEGWGFFPDMKMIEQARKMDLPHCKRLEELGYRPY